MRSFVSVEVNGSCLSEAQAYLRKCVRGSFSDLSDSHLTLSFLGEKSEGEVEKITRELASVSFPSFDLELNGVGFFPSQENPRVAWAGVGKGLREVVELQKIISESIGFKEDKTFTPHVTLARVKMVEDKNLLMQFLKKFSGPFGSFPVKRFFLNKSILGEKTAVHEKILEVKLT